jgi:hypothetical protein
LDNPVNSDSDNKRLKFFLSLGIGARLSYLIRKKIMKYYMVILSMLLINGCSQESQNKFGRTLQNWTGTNGVLDIYAGDKLVKRFIKIDKLSTATATDGNSPRPYRYGYGYIDENQNLIVDNGEKRVYFEFSDYSTAYVFYENYKN